MLHKKMHLISREKANNNKQKQQQQKNAMFMQKSAAGVIFAVLSILSEWKSGITKVLWMDSQPSSHSLAAV